MTSSIAVARDTGEVRTRLDDLVAGGARELAIDDPVDLTLRDPASMDAMRLLRDAVGHGLRLRWRAVPTPGVSVADLTHLPPPSNLDDLAALPGSDADTWAELYSFGQLFYRIGPGFVSIKDVRPTVSAARMVLEGPDADAFLALADGREDTGGSPTLREELREYRLAVASDGGFLVLPYRIRQWPIPFSAI